MEKTRVVIVEDQLLISESIASKLEKAGFEVLAQYDTGEEAVAGIAANKPEIILMDIHLAGKLDGIETAHRIREKFDMPVIYLTDHIDEATVDKAKYTQPENYLAKPFNEQALIRAVKLAEVKVQKNKKNQMTQSSHTIMGDSVFIKDNQVAEKVKYEDILFLEADRSYCKVVTKEKLYTLSISMNKVSEQIKHPSFVRVHRSYVVNINNITGIEGNLLKMGDHKVMANKEFREQFLSKFRFIK